MSGPRPQVRAEGRAEHRSPLGRSTLRTGQRDGQPVHYAPEIVCGIWLAKGDCTTNFQSDGVSPSQGLTLAVGEVSPGRVSENRTNGTLTHHCLRRDRPSDRCGPPASCHNTYACSQLRVDLGMLGQRGGIAWTILTNFVDARPKS